MSHGKKRIWHLKSYSYYSHLYRMLQYIFIWLCFQKSFCSQLFFLVNVAHVGSSNIDISQASNIDKILSALALHSNHYLLLYHVYINNLWVQLRLSFKLSVYYNALFIKKHIFLQDPSRPKYSWMASHEENMSGTPGQYMPYSTTVPKIEAWVPPKSKWKLPPVNASN